MVYYRRMDEALTQPKIPEPQIPGHPYLIGKEVAEILGLSARTITRLTHQGYIKYAFKLAGGNGWIVYDAEYIYRWKAWNEYEGIEEGGDIPNYYPPETKQHFTEHGDDQ